MLLLLLLGAHAFQPTHAWQEVARKKERHDKAASTHDASKSDACHDFQLNEFRLTWRIACACCLGSPLTG
jgi:hypothetical protein